MNYNEIDRLLERYLEGETSLGEERILRDFFAQKDLSAKYKPYSEMFHAFQTVASDRLNDRRFDKAWTGKLRGRSGQGKSVFSSGRWYAVTGIAATLLLAVILFVPLRKLPLVNHFSQKIEDTFDDPRQAYQETIRALLVVSEKLNAGTDQMKDLEKFDAGMKEAERLSVFNEDQIKINNL